MESPMVSETNLNLRLFVVFDVQILEKRGHLSQVVLILKDRTQVSLDCIAPSAVRAIGPFGSN